MALIGVSPNGERWQLTREGEILALYGSRDEAMDAARELAEDGESRVTVVDQAADVTDVMGGRPGSDGPSADGHRGSSHPEPNEAR